MYIVGLFRCAVCKLVNQAAGLIVKTKFNAWHKIFCYLHHHKNFRILVLGNFYVIPTFWSLFIVCCKTISVWSRSCFPQHPKKPLLIHILLLVF